MQSSFDIPSELSLSSIWMHGSSDADLSRSDLQFSPVNALSPGFRSTEWPSPTLALTSAH